MGAKGSGRKSRYEEIQRGNLLEVCTTWLVNNFESFDKETKIKVALEIAKKGIVQRIDANVNYSAKMIVEAVNAASNRITNHV